MKEILKKLEYVGFTNNEAKVFLVLYKGKNMTATEIAKEADIPRTSVYEILKSFANQGICNEIQTATKMRYEMIDPKVVEDKISKSIKDEQKNKLQSLTDSFESLRPHYGSEINELGLEQVELIKGFNKHRHIKFIELLKEAQREVLIMNRIEGHVSGEIDEAGMDLIKKGGTVRSIYETSPSFKLKQHGKWETVSEEELLNLYLSFEKLGEQVRLTKKIIQNLTIFDREIVFINLVNKNIPGNERTDIIVYNKSFAEYSANNFEKSWEEAETLEQFKERIEAVHQ